MGQDQNTATRLASLVEMRVVSRRPNGAGTIEIPLLRAGRIDRSMTSGGGEGEYEITTEDLRQIANNFDAMGRPVPVGIGEHEPFGARGGPQPAFVRSLTVRDATLFGVVDLNPAAFEAVVIGESLRGFSVEMARDRKTPTGKVEGWSLHGGVFTNRPAVPVHFAPPLEEMATSMVLSLEIARSEGRVEEEKMPEQEVSLEALQAEAKAREEKIANLNEALEAATRDRDKVTEEASKLERRVGELEDKLNGAEAVGKAKARTAEELEQRVNKQQEQIATLTAEVEERKKSDLGREVRDRVLAAVRDGVDPAAFDGYKEEPAVWLTENFGSLKVLDSFIGRLPRDEKRKKAALSSGRDLATDDSVSLSEEERDLFERLGLDAEFVGVRSEEEARKKLAAKKAREQKG